MEDRNICAGCRFYHNKFLQCRKNPPVYADLNYDCFPPTTASSWCGQWKSRHIFVNEMTEINGKRALLSLAEKRVDEQLRSDKVLEGVLLDLCSGVDRIAAVLETELNERRSKEIETMSGSGVKSNEETVEIEAKTETENKPDRHTFFTNLIVELRTQDVKLNIIHSYLHNIMTELPEISNKTIEAHTTILRIESIFNRLKCEFEAEDEAAKAANDTAADDQQEE